MNAKEFEKAIYYFTDKVKERYNFTPETVIVSTDRDDIFKGSVLIIYDLHGDLIFFKHDYKNQKRMYKDFEELLTTIDERYKAEALKQVQVKRGRTEEELKQERIKWVRDERIIK